jgi:hypothetical protein
MTESGSKTDKYQVNSSKYTLNYNITCRRIRIIFVLNCQTAFCSGLAGYAEQSSGLLLRILKLANRKIPFSAFVLH